MKFKRLRVKGYRCLTDVDLELRELMVLVGPNGSGKTSLLEVFTLLREGVQERLSDALAERGGVTDLLSRDGTDALEIELEATSLLRPEPLCYSVRLERMGIGYRIARESLTQWQDPSARQPFIFLSNAPGDRLYFDPRSRLLVTPDWDFKESELALAQVPRMYQEPAELRNCLAQTRMYSFLDVSRRAVVRLPQDLRPADLPGPNGEDLFAALYTLRALDELSFERIEEALRAAFPGFRKLEFPLVGAGQATLAWYQDPFTKPLYPHQLSEGTLRFLWLSTVLLSPNLPPITLIDEPEVSLHPELLKLLAGILREAATHTQLIVATHADQLIRWLDPDEVATMDIEDGRASVTWADTRADLAEWLELYTLDRVWLMGEIGARP